MKQNLITRLALCFLLAVSVFIFPGSSFAYAGRESGRPENIPTAEQEAKQVFILNPFSRGYTWRDNALRGIDDVFSASGLKIETYGTFMDMKRVLLTPQYFEQLRNLIREGYKDVQFDAVLACDNDALDFLRKYRDKLFPGTPVVFSSINDFDESMLDGRKDITDTSENTDYAGIIRAVLQLRPAARNIVVVMEDTTTGRAHRSAVEKIRNQLVGIFGMFAALCALLVHLLIEARKRRETETVLCKNRMMLFHVLDIVPRPIFWKDRAGVYLGCNENFARAAGLDNPAQVVGKTDHDLPCPRVQADAYQADDQEVIQSNQHKRHIIETGRSPDGTPIWADTTKMPLTDTDGILGIYEDITVRRRVESEREVMLKLLNLIAQPNSIERLLNDSTRLLHDWSECEAVGVRLQKGEDFPYYVTMGFPPNFVKLENSLCALDQKGELVHDSNGDPIRECMCGNVICGRFNPALPFFTENGSFWTNCTTELLASTTEADRQANTRNRCNGMGYESVALIPLHYGSRALGLIQFNDHRKDRFDEAKIALFERLASSLAIGVIQRQTDEGLRESEERYQRITATITDYIYTVHVDGNGQTANTIHGPGCLAVTGYQADEFMNDPFLWFQMVAVEDRPMVEEQARRILLGEDPPPIEHRIVHKNGTTRWVRNTFVPHRDEQGRLATYDGLIQNITERKQAEEKLRKSEERFHSLFISSPTAIDIFRLEEDGRLIVIQVNPAAERMTGIDAAALLGKSIEEAFPGLVNTEIPNMYRAIARGELKAQNYERHYKDGRFSGWYALAAFRMGENTIGVETIDITKRKETEIQQESMLETLRESEEKYRLLHEAAGVGIGYYTPDGIVISYNKVAATHMNGSPEEFVGRPIHEIFPRADADIYLDRIRKATESEMPQEYVDRVDLPSTVKWFNSTFTRVVNSTGKVVGIQIISTDITERKQMEEALQKSEERYRSLFDNMTEGFALHELIFDESGDPCDYRFLDINHAFEQITGLKRENLIGRGQREVLPEEDPFWFKAYSRVALSGVSVHIEHYSPSLERYYEVYAYCPVRNQFAVIFSDITERKQAEDFILQLNATLEQRVEDRTRELREAQEQLVEQEKLAVLGQLAGSVGHELRNPLGVISNAIFFLKMIQADADDKVREYLDLIENSIHNANKIVTDLLDFTRVKPAERASISVAETVQRALTQFPVPDNVKVKLNLPANLPEAYADPSQVTKALGSLFLNACQAMENRGGVLTISACAQDSHETIRIIVQDTGTGISPENMKKLFEPLFTTKAKGIGLGLAVGKKLIEANGGKIWVESEPGVGSRFYLELQTMKNP